jgi:hypothetical protein
MSAAHEQSNTLGSHDREWWRAEARGCGTDWSSLTGLLC